MTEMHRLLAKALGLEFLETIADRRGSLLLKVRRGNRVMALKAHDSGQSDTYDRQKLLIHEAVALRLLGDLNGKQYVDSGDHPVYGAWLLTRWVTGSPVTLVASELRKQSASMVALFSQIAHAYAAVNEAGVLHADVQPAHLLIQSGSEQMLILDFGLARLATGGNLEYKGSLVHYTAPEVAAGVLAKLLDIPYGVSQEVYSIGALMYYLYTSLPAIDYGAGELRQIPFATKLAAVEANRLRGFESADAVHSDLQGVILMCLSADQASRPSSAER